MKNNTNKNVLFFFTADFPYGKKEIFIENEVPFLLNNFDSVIIISGANELKDIRSLPKNIKLINIPYYKNLKLRWFFQALIHPYFFKELLLMGVLHKKIPTIGRLKTIITSLCNSLRLSKLYEIELKKISDNYNKILYSFWFNDSTIALGHLRNKDKKLIVISRAHRWDLYFNENKYHYLPFRYQTPKDLSCVYSASIDGINYCRNVWGVHKSKITLSRLGVKQQKFIPADNKKILVSCSNIIPIKRVDKIIQSLFLVKTKNLKWIHFGVGPELEKVKSTARKILPKNISFEFLGHVKNNFLLDWYKINKPSIFINLSSNEGIPVSIMESMSFGIPCIATKVGGSEELVTKKVGYPIEKELSNKKIAIIIDEFFKLSIEKKNKIRLNSYNHIQKNFNSSKNYNAFFNEIQAL